MTGIERLRELAVRHREIGKELAALNLDDIANQIEREMQASNEVEKMKCATDEVSVSAYDLLPEEDRNAIAWVRENGGLGAVQARVDTLRDTLDWLRELAGVGKDELVDYDELLDALDRRLMPEGMEWLVEAWPRFEDGELVRVGDEFMGKDGKTYTVKQIRFMGFYFSLYDFCDERPQFRADYGERVKRPAPKVLDADGVEIELGDDLYSVEGGLKLHVGVIDTRNGKIATAEMYALDKWADPAMYTHRAPVLAADGRPLREGETVYFVGWDLARTVEKVEGDSVWITGRKEPADASQLTHERPDSFEQLEKDANDLVYDVGFHLGDYSPSDFKEPGDSVQDRIRDLVRRAKALSERDA